MPALSFNRSDPKNFILVADRFFSDYQPGKDHVWKLRLETSDPHPFTLSTTYGLRAKSMRLFPNFILDNQRISKPTDFSQPPRMTAYTPSFAKIEAVHQDNLAFCFSCYLPEPDILVGYIKIENLGDALVDLTTQLAVNLTPMGNGQPSHPEKSGSNYFLAGKLESLEPVLFMTCGPKGITNPFPALSVQINIQPTESQEISWVLVSKETKTVSLEKAKKIIASDWLKNALDHSMSSASQTIQVKTGDPGWDKAFYLAQVHARTHLVRCQEGKPELDFIRSRLPDQSSLLETGDHNSEKITNLELNHLSQLLLPANVDEMASLVRNKLSRFKNRINSQNNGRDQIKKKSTNPCPMLGSITLEIYEISKDQDFLTQVFPDLYEIFYLWTEDHISVFKGEGISWDTPDRLHCEAGLFIFNLWESYGKGLDIKRVESPALYALLYREAKALYKIARILGESSKQRFFSRWQKDLFKRLEGCWRDEQAIYGYQDLQSHASPSRQLYFPSPVKDKIVLNKHFTEHQRLQIHLTAADEHTRACVVRINGLSPQGEHIQETYRSIDILWVLRRAHLTTENLFSEITSIEFEGLKESDQFILETADYSQHDITCLLPLWAGAGNEIHRQKIASVWLDPQDPDFAHGIPELWQSQQPLPDEVPVRVNVLWNTLIIEGLLKQSQVEKAAALFSNLMTSIIRGLKKYDGFFPFFDSQTGQPAGQYNDITGFPPLGLFLQIAGIKLFSPNQVALWGHNPFPWPIEVYWQGLYIHRDKLRTKINFPNGETYHHESGKPVLLTSEITASS